jgi:hypothetical protein
MPNGDFRLFIPKYIHVCSDKSNKYYGMTSIIVYNLSNITLCVQVQDVAGIGLRAICREHTNVVGPHSLNDARNDITCVAKTQTVFGISATTADKLVINGHVIYGDLPMMIPDPDSVPRRVNLTKRKDAVDGVIGHHSYQLPGKIKGHHGGTKRRFTSHFPGVE